MESNQRKTISFEIPTKEEIAAKRPLIPVSFGVAILMFFLPFCNIRCTNGQKIVSVTGLQLVTGKKAQGGPADGAHKIPANIWAILALGAAIGGLALYLKKHRREAFFGAIAGVAGFLSLVILNVTADTEIRELEVVPVEVDFRLAYWLALIAMGVAGAISYLRFQAEKGKSAVEQPMYSEDDPLV